MFTSIHICNKKKFRSLLESNLTVKVLYDDIMRVIHNTNIFPTVLTELINEYVVDDVIIKYKITISKSNQVYIVFDILGLVLYEPLQFSYTSRITTHKRTINYFLYTLHHSFSFLKEQITNKTVNSHIPYDHIQFLNYYIKSINNSTQYLRNDTFSIKHNYEQKNNDEYVLSTKYYTLERKITNHHHCIICIEIIKQMNNLTIKSIRIIQQMTLQSVR